MGARRIDEPLRRALLWRAMVACGVAVGAVVAIAAGFWMIGESPGAVDGAVPWTWLCWVASALLVAAVVAAARFRRRVSSIALRLVAAAGFVCFGIAGVIEQVERFRGGYPGWRGVAVVLGGFSAAALTLLWPNRRAVLGLTDDAPNGMHRWLPVVTFVPVAIVAAVVPVAAPFSISSALERRVVDHQVTTRTTVPLSRVTVSRTAWTAAIDDDVREVLPGGGGIIVRVDDGLISLDGRTGGVRWHYHRVGADATDLQISADGVTALLTIGPPGGSADDQQLIAFTAATGNIRFTRTLSEVARDGGQFGDGVPTTNFLFWASGDPIGSYSLADGRSRSTLALAEGCRWSADHAVPLAQGVLVVCAGRSSVAPFEPSRSPPTAGARQRLSFAMASAVTGNLLWELPDFSWGSGAAGTATPSPDNLVIHIAADGRNAYVNPVSGELYDTEPLRSATGSDDVVALGYDRTALVVLDGRLATFDFVDGDLARPVGMPAPETTELVLREGVVATATPGNAAAANGRIEFQGYAFTGEVSDLTVDLRGPYEQAGAPFYDVITAPGAAVVYSTRRPLDGGSFTFVGLR